MVHHLHYTLLIYFFNLFFYYIRYTIPLTIAIVEEEYNKSKQSEIRLYLPYILQFNSFWLNENVHTWLIANKLQFEGHKTEFLGWT